MGNKKDKEMVRCELENYVAVEIKNTSPNARQVDAIQKMISLPERNFDELVSDIVNEMRRRSNALSTTPETPMQRKLSRIHEDGFKSLILDLLLVMNQRSPEKGCSSENVHGLIDNLDKLISELKEDMMNEDKMVQDIYSSRNISEKLIMFIEYTRNVFGRNEEDVKIHEYMTKEVREYFDSQATDGPDLMAGVDVFLKKCDKSKYSNHPEYKYHRDNIQKLESMELEQEVKRNLIKSEVSQIYSIFVAENTSLKSAGEKQLELKVHGLVDILSKIKYEAEERRSVDAYDYLEEVINSSKDILELIESMKLKRNTHLDLLRAKIAALEQIHNRNGNEEPLFAMFSTIEAVKKALMDISNNQNQGNA
ncbi:uncharacterized protein Eint_020190 [Encephalitozoon intestinalis ATCC 50506]|uniref:GIT Spa2 homology (SHD) domain-containing protein n=1 Tax=Encephalitozoon intestinalis (strain ATCC 50506) TaxID=876142 RepID=E0S5N5_ENCIT|nr:uncharacterized protein Eint_020190 [Encephalitozoon intestinalis ATCC 50506]ADM11020.1 hypothetical protein Eint_020190 [Encephalitozoon intestinalis ATCC 50506]UTX44668.1 putative alpha-helical pore forming toxin [Encephalitozoon intestinalis]